MIDCGKIQRLFDDLADSRLAEGDRQEVERHLRDCTDCRVAQQRAVRLQQLLALKRHEQPGSQYFENFLDNFHRRLELSILSQPGWWERLSRLLRDRSRPVLRYGFAHAIGVAIAVVLIYRGSVGTDWTSITATADQPVITSLPPATSPALVVPHSVPGTIVSLLSEPLDLTPASSNILSFTVPALAEDNTPRYVLDRFAVTPVSYDVASIRF
jgi:anti-sigma factor RsiW